mgnify:CR=1 FL=1
MANSPELRSGLQFWFRIVCCNPWLASLRIVSPVLVRLAFYPLTWRPASRLLIWWMEKVPDLGGEVGRAWRSVLRLQHGLLQAESTQELQAYVPAYRALDLQVEALRAESPPDLHG